MTETPAHCPSTTPTTTLRRVDYAELAAQLRKVYPYLPFGPVKPRPPAPDWPLTAAQMRERARASLVLRDLQPPFRAPYERLVRDGDLVDGASRRDRSPLIGGEGPGHVHWHMLPPDEPSRIMRTLRAFFGDRPPMYGPVPRAALAAGAAAVVEISARVKPYGETVGHRPAGELAQTVLEAGAPYIQRSMLQRVAGEKVWTQGWWVLGQVVAATVGLVCAVVFAVVAGVTWLAAAAGCALAMHVFGLHQIWASNRRQIARAEELLKRPSPEAGEATVDIKAAGR